MNEELYTKNEHILIWTGILRRWHMNCYLVPVEIRIDSVIAFPWPILPPTKTHILLLWLFLDTQGQRKIAS